MKRTQVTLAISVLVLWLGAPIGVTKALSETVALEPEERALFVYNFAGYIDWPSRTETDRRAPSRVIAVVGRSEFGEALTRLIGVRKPGDRRVVVRTLGANAAAERAGPRVASQLLRLARLAMEPGL